MAKIILGQRPTSFKRTIGFALPGDDKGTIEVDFKYRTRSEHAKWVDEMKAEAKASAEQEIERFKSAIESNQTVDEPSQADLVAHQNAFNARYLMGALENWNLDVPFDEKAVEQLVDEVPAAVGAIIDAYRAAIVEGRLGN